MDITIPPTECLESLSLPLGSDGAGELGKLVT